MSYMRRSGQKWAKKHPMGSAILGIAFGLTFTIIGFKGGIMAMGLIFLAYTIYCVYCLFKAL